MIIDHPDRLRTGALFLAALAFGAFTIWWDQPLRVEARGPESFAGTPEVQRYFPDGDGITASGVFTSSTTITTSPYTTLCTTGLGTTSNVVIR